MMNLIVITPVLVVLVLAFIAFSFIILRWLCSSQLGAVGGIGLFLLLLFLAVGLPASFAEMRYRAARAKSEALRIEHERLLDSVERSRRRSVLKMEQEVERIDKAIYDAMQTDEATRRVPHTETRSSRRQHEDTQTAKIDVAVSTSARSDDSSDSVSTAKSENLVESDHDAHQSLSDHATSEITAIAEVANDDDLLRSLDVEVEQQTNPMENTSPRKSWVDDPPAVVDGYEASVVVSDPSLDLLQCTESLIEKSAAACERYLRAWFDDDVSVTPQLLAAAVRDEYVESRMTSQGLRQIAYRLLVFDDDFRQQAAIELKNAQRAHRFKLVSLSSGLALGLLSLGYGSLSIAQRRQRCRLRK